MFKRKIINNKYRTDIEVSELWKMLVSSRVKRFMIAVVFSSASNIPPDDSHQN